MMKVHQEILNEEEPAENKNNLLSALHTHVTIGMVGLGTGLGIGYNEF